MKTSDEIKQIFDTLFQEYFVTKDYFDFGDERHDPEIQKKWGGKIFDLVSRVRNHLLGVEDYPKALNLIQHSQIFTRTFLIRVDGAPKKGGVKAIQDFYLQLQKDAVQK